LPNFFEAGLEFGMLGVCRDAALACLQPWRVHAPLVLGEEIFAVEVIRLARGWTGSAGSGRFGGWEKRVGCRGVAVNAAFSHVATIEA
jgi:hypothetical protein